MATPLIWQLPSRGNSPNSPPKIATWLSLQRLIEEPVTVTRAVDGVTHTMQESWDSVGCDAMRWGMGWDGVGWGGEG